MFLSENSVTDTLFKGKTDTAFRQAAGIIRMSLPVLISCIKVEKTQKKFKCPPCSLPGKTLMSPPVVFTGRHLCPPCSLPGKTLMSPPVVFTGRHLWPRPKQDLNTLAQTYDELTFKAVVVKMVSSRKRQTSHASGGKMDS